MKSNRSADILTPGEPSAVSKRQAHKLGLRLVAVGELTIARRKQRSNFYYVDRNGRRINDKLLMRRLDRLAVPPAYVKAFYCPDPRGHLQAVWRDAAGRLQYRYHEEWTTIREARKLRRLRQLAEALPKIRRALAHRLRANEPSREFALAVAVELVAASGIRAGRESYARINGTRGAATLLKNNVRVKGQSIALSFRAKGGKILKKEIRSCRLATAIRALQKIPGSRLFQYRNRSGVSAIRARDVNQFLRDVSGLEISLKDLRTLTASNAALEAFRQIEPADNEGRRKKQIVEAITVAAEELGNTPAICRKSYIPAPLVAAFEKGRLHRAIKSGPTKGRKLLAQLAAS
jgi:DNA topoisomerase-1